MSQMCPRCNEPVGPDELSCPGCGADLDPYGTIPQPGPKRNFQPAREVPAERPPERKKRPTQERPRPEPRPVEPPKVQQPTAGYPAEPTGGDPPIAPGRKVGWIRGGLIRALGGDRPFEPPAPAPPQPARQAGPTPTAAELDPQADRPSRAPAPPPAPARFSKAELDAKRTVAAHGINIGQLKIPRQTYMLQIFDSEGRWCDWGPIHGSGLPVGRSKSSANFPGLNTMAVRHMRFSYEGRSGLVVDDLGSLNGVYLRVDTPVELHDGGRFRVGSQLIEFRRVDAFEPAEVAVADDGETFFSRDLEPLAFLDLIRPDNRAGLRFPIVHPELTVIGRERDGVNLVLPGDETVSGQHARLRRRDDQFFLEDMNSRNGTFVHLIGATPVKSGDVLMAGKVLFRVRDQREG